MIHDFINKTGKSFNDPEIKKIDLLYHELGEEGLFQKFSDKLGLEKIVDDDEVMYAMHIPPIDTRAYGRTKLLRDLKLKNMEIIIVDWDSITYGENGENKVINLSDPYENYENLEIL